MSDQTPPTTPDEADEEHHKITGKEIALFLIFGVLPFGAIYTFAAQGAQDAAGKTFEQERRLVMAQCLKTLKRNECRRTVDTRILPCYAEHVSQGVQHAEPLKDTTRDALNRCISRDPKAVFRPNNVPTDDEVKAAREAIENR